MYVWQPHTEPPKSKRARFFISQATEQRPRDVLVLLDSWDLSKGSLQKYRFDRSEIGSFKSSHTTSSTGTELYLFIYAAYKSLIEDTTSFINGAYEQLDNFVSSRLIKLSDSIKHLNTALRNIQDGRVHPVESFIFCFILTTAVVYPHPDYLMLASF